MIFKLVKSIFYSFLTYFLFVAFLSKAQEDKIAVNMNKIFPSSILENFHEIISHEINYLKNCGKDKCNLQSYLDTTLDSAIDFHVYIHLLKNEINIKESYFKEDLDNLIYFITRISDMLAFNLNNYACSKKEAIKLLLDKAISKLRTICA